MSTSRRVRVMSMVRNTEDTGHIEKRLVSIHKAIIELLSTYGEARNQHKVDKRVSGFRTLLRNAYVRKADLMMQAVSDFNITYNQIQLHWQEAECYGFKNKEDREEILQQMMHDEEVYLKQRAPLSNPDVLEVPKEEKGVRPGVPDYVVWVDEAALARSCCRRRDVNKLAKLDGVQLYFSDENPSLLQIVGSRTYNALYIRSPLEPALVRSTDLESYLDRTRVGQLLRFLRYMGAEKVTFEKSNSNSLSTELAAGITEAHIDASVSHSNTHNSSDSQSVVVTFPAKQPGYSIPWREIEKLVCYQQDREWQRIRDLREEGLTNATLNFVHEESRANKTSVALTLMKHGFEGSYNREHKSTQSVKCQVTFTDMKKYDTADSVSLDEKGYKRLLVLDNAQDQIQLFARRYMRQHKITIPSANETLLCKALSRSVASKQGFSSFEELIYIHLGHNPEGLLHVLALQKQRVLERFVLNSLKAKDTISSDQEAMVADAMGKLLTFFSLYAEVQSEGLQIFQILLNFSDDLLAKKVVYSRKRGEVIDCSLKPSKETIHLMEQSWDALLYPSQHSGEYSPISTRSLQLSPQPSTIPLDERLLTRSSSKVVESRV
ncbi:MAG: hypothetical protein K0U13_03560 [Chlamydiae bacterium]|nr:hypothetical protein [Chlamydiota bacterium]